MSQDPVYLFIGNANLVKQKTGAKLQQFLQNPQDLNSYSYSANRPISVYDPNGEWFKEFFTGQDSNRLSCGANAKDQPIATVFLQFSEDEKTVTLTGVDIETGFQYCTGTFSKDAATLQGGGLKPAPAS